MNYNYSIIIPHYNNPQLLSRCLDSIPNREDVQVVVVDDCSSDEKQTEIREVLIPKYSHVSFIFQEENKGAGRCRNVGMDVAEGKWLLFADCDDFYSNDILSLLDKYGDSDADIVYFGVDNVSSDDPTVKINRRLYNNERIALFLEKGDDIALRYRFPEPWSKMFNATFVRSHKVRFSETKVCNDYYFSAITGYYAQKMMAERSILYIVTSREGSISYVTDTVPKLLDRINVAVSVQNFLRKHNVVLEEKYQAEKLENRLISLFKLDPIEGLKTLNRIRKTGMPISSILKKMVSIFVSNRFSKA